MQKILGQTKFQPQEFPRGHREKERRAKVSDYNGQFKTPEPIIVMIVNISQQLQDIWICIENENMVS